MKQWSCLHSVQPSQPNCAECSRSRAGTSKPSHPLWMGQEKNSPHKKIHFPKKYVKFKQGITVNKTHSSQCLSSWKQQRRSFPLPISFLSPGKFEKKIIEWIDHEAPYQAPRSSFFTIWGLVAHHMPFSTFMHWIWRFSGVSGNFPFLFPLVRGGTLFAVYC